MTNVAKRNDVGRIEDPRFVVLHENNVVHLQKIGFFRLVRDKAAVLTGKIIPGQNRVPEVGVSLVSAFAARLVSIFFSKCNEVKILGKPVRVLIRIVVPVIRSGSSLLANRSVSRLREPFVPRLFLSKLRSSAVWVMAALVFWNAQSVASPLVIYGEGHELLAASTFTSNANTGPLLFGNTHVSSLPDAGNIEKRVNCWDPLRAPCTTAWPATASAMVKKQRDWAISSQASWEQVEGSTTRVWSPERTVKPHECAPRKGRYSLGLRETVRSAGLNACAITKRPYTGKLDDLSYHPVKKIVNKVLKNDAMKAFDTAAHAQFNQTPLRAVGGASGAITLTTNGTATATNSVALGKDHIKTIVDTMKERNIPAYQGDDYYALAWPTTYRTLKNDLETIHQYTETGFQMIMNGEIGRYENVRFVEQTYIAKSSWTNGLSDWAFFFGEDTVAEGIACPEEMRGKIPDDYGRGKGVAWYYLGGFGIVHTNATQARILKWDSAA